jgi:uncharacterized membrane protein (UPF0127 family)
MIAIAKSGGRLALFGLLCLLLAGAGSLFPDALAQEPPGSAVTEQLSIETAGGAQVFRVEVAADEAARERGLMFRKTLPPGSGMLFDFNPARPVAFWMKNTFIPLDMIFIGADGRILNIAERTVPQSLTPVPSEGSARAVLEIAGGAASRLGIRPGDRVRHRILPP